MSDISITFPWPVLVLFYLAVGWPGLIIGAVLGAMLWKRRRWLGAVIGGVALDVVWAGAWLSL